MFETMEVGLIKKFKSLANRRNDTCVGHSTFNYFLPVLSKKTDDGNTITMGILTVVDFNNTVNEIWLSSSTVIHMKNENSYTVIPNEINKSSEYASLLSVDNITEEAKLSINSSNFGLSLSAMLNTFFANKENGIPPPKDLSIFFSEMLKYIANYEFTRIERESRLTFYIKTEKLVGDNSYHHFGYVEYCYL